MTVCPIWTVPVICGTASATGTATPFAAAPAGVGAAVAAAVPAFVLAVTVTVSVLPMSAAPGVYVSNVAPGIATQLVVQLCHWYANATGFPPFHVPGIALSFSP